MPEIAEVKTVAKALKKQLLNKKIKDIKILHKNIITTDINFFKNNLINKEIIGIDTNGKWIIFEVTDFYLLSHLRMEGKYFIKSKTDKIEKHEHIIFYFDNFTLRYHDTRKFGKMTIIKKEELKNYEPLKKLGPEPNTKELTKEYLYEKINKKATNIKTLLLDQTIINGLGNIYANEVLFRARINPKKIGKDITLKECENIINASNYIIKKATLEGGTTIKSYTSQLGVEGNYQKFLLVHMKDNKLCSKCKEKIKKIKLNGRSTYYCPNCQK